MLIRRWTATVGVVVGFGAGGGAAAILAMEGVVGRGALSVELADQTRVWDTTGSDDRGRWVEAVRPGYRFDSLRHVVIETGAASFRWAGSRAAPTAFAPVRTAEREDGQLPLGPTPVAGYDPGPATLAARSGTQASVRFRSRGLQETLIARVGYRGYERRIERIPRDSSRLPGAPLGVIEPPALLTDGVQVLGALRTGGRPVSGVTVVLPAQGAAALATADASWAPFIATSVPLAISLQPISAGPLHEVLARPQAPGRSYSLYYAELPSVDGTQSMIVPPERVLNVRGEQGSTALLFTGLARGRDGSTLVLSPSGRRIDPRRRHVAAFPLAGPGATFTSLLAEATASFRSP